MVAAEEPVELFETATHRVQSIRQTKMPFPKQRRTVADRFQSIGHRRFGERQPEFRRAIGIELVAETLWIPAGHESRTRRAAIRTAHVCVRETDPVASELIDI